MFISNLKSLIVLICLILVYSAPSFAQNDGGASGNGGDAPQSSIDDVRDFLSLGDNAHSAFMLYASYFIYDGLRAGTIVPVQNPRAREILSKIQAKFPDLPDRDNLKEMFAPQKPACRDGKLKKDASFKWVNGKATICLSTNLLSRFSFTALTAELPPLIFHELAHGAGYGETDAQFIEKYVDRVYKSGSASECYFNLTGLMGDGSNADFIITVRVNTDASVPYEKELPTTGFYPDEIEPGQHTATSYHVDPLSDDEADRQFTGDWSFKKGGWISFPIQNPDGTTAIQKIEFGPYEKGAAPILTQSIMWNGQARTLKQDPKQGGGLHFVNPGCFR